MIFLNKFSKRNISSEKGGKLAFLVKIKLS